jgi:tripartite-type tricarboxylate transporter receptor subunit TctC
MMTRRALPTLVRLVCSTLLGAAVPLLTALSPATAQDFYANRTVTIVVGFPPGGGVDAGARLLQRHLGKFIPGNPSIVIQNMPGASGLVAANHLYARAERDGLTLGLPGRDWVMYSALQLKAAQFDSLKYNFIGSTGAVNNYGWVRADLGIKSAAQLKAHAGKVVIGALSPATVTASVPNMLIANGYPLQVVTGYRGTVQIVQAIEQKEVHGIFTNLATFSRRSDLIDNAVIRLFQVFPDVKDLPLVEELVPEKTRPLMRAVNAPSSTGMPFIAPPEVPAERVAVLRKAFLAMARDKDFMADAEKIGEPTGAPIAGEKLVAVYRELIAGTTPEVAKAFRELTGLK